MNISSLPAVAIQVQKPQNPTSPNLIRTPIVELPQPDVLRMPFVGAFKDAVLAANKLVHSSRGAAWGVVQLQTPNNFDFVPLGVESNGAIEPFSFNNFGPDMPIGGAYTERFERTDATGAIVAIVGSSQFADLHGGAANRDVASLEELGFKAGIDFPID